MIYWAASRTLPPNFFFWLNRFSCCVAEVILSLRKESRIHLWVSLWLHLDGWFTVGASFRPTHTGYPITHVKKSQGSHSDPWQTHHLFHLTQLVSASVEESLEWMEEPVNISFTVLFLSQGLKWLSAVLLWVSRHYGLANAYPVSDQNNKMHSSHSKIKCKKETTQTGVGKQRERETPRRCQHQTVWSVCGSFTSL